MESRDCLVLRVCLPNWVSYEIENKDDLGEDVVTEKSNQIVDINISKYMGDVCAQKEISFPIILELMSNSLETRIGGQVIAKYYLVKKDGTYSKVYSFIFRIIQFIVIFLKFDVKWVDKKISTK